MLKIRKPTNITIYMETKNHTYQITWSNVNSLNTHKNLNSEFQI